MANFASRFFSVKAEQKAPLVKISVYSNTAAGTTFTRDSWRQRFRFFVYGILMAFTLYISIIIIRECLASGAVHVLEVTDPPNLTSFLQLQSAIRKRSLCKQKCSLLRSKLTPHTYIDRQMIPHQLIHPDITRDFEHDT